ncbi:MAG: chemotaxis protein CheA [Acidobacteriota bacterium]
MTDDPILVQLLEAFTTEADDNLAEMEQAILQLERSPEDIELVRIIFRAAHSVKGDAACVGRTAVADCAHALEDLMEKIEAAAVEVSGGTTTLLLRTVDALRNLVEAGEAPTEDRHEIIGELQRAAAAVAGAPMEPVTPGSPSAARAPVAALPRRTLRVEVNRLDQLLDLTGEITVARGRVEAMLQSGESLERILEAFRESDRLHTDLQEIVSRARMVPVGPMFRQFARTVRDVSAANGKLAELILEGEEVEVDTNVVEHLRDPLTHMIRNAIDHGLEAPHDRHALGKDVVGKLILSATHESGTVVIRLTDDGRGLERQKLLERAQRRGVIPAGVVLSDLEIQRLIFEPGLTTSDVVSELSGRGLGMDIVRRSVEALRGRIDTLSIEGTGTTFTIRLPLTLAIIDGFGFRVAGETYILPLDTVVECVELRRDLTTCDGQSSGLLNLRDRPLPYIRLRHHLATGGTQPDREYVVVVDQGGRSGGLVVDSLLGELQVVIKPLNRICRPDRSITGSAVLGDGRVALIVDAATILDEAISAEAASTPVHA